MMENLKDFLTEVQLSQYLENFTKNGLTFDDLPQLSNQDLVEIGIEALGHRKKILYAAGALSQSAPSGNRINSDYERRPWPPELGNGVGPNPAAIENEQNQPTHDRSKKTISQEIIDKYCAGHNDLLDSMGKTGLTGNDNSRIETARRIFSDPGLLVTIGQHLGSFPALKGEVVLARGLTNFRWMLKLDGAVFSIPLYRLASYGIEADESGTHWAVSYHDESGKVVELPKFTGSSATEAMVMQARQAREWENLNEEQILLLESGSIEHLRRVNPSLQIPTVGALPKPRGWTGQQNEVVRIFSVFNTRNRILAGIFVVFCVFFYNSWGPVPTESQAKSVDFCQREKQLHECGNRALYTAPCWYENASGVSHYETCLKAYGVERGFKPLWGVFGVLLCLVPFVVARMLWLNVKSGLNSRRSRQ